MRGKHLTVLVVVLGAFFVLLPAACSIDRRSFSGDLGGGGAGGGSAGMTTSTTSTTSSADPCTNGVKDGDETDTDCGTSACGACEQGKSCLDASQQPHDGACKSGHCVDGVCCGDKCSESCWSCVSARTGKADGECAPVKMDSDPDNDCMDGGTKKCEFTGSCDGAGACAVIGCSFANGSGQCQGDVCQFSGCSPDFADCNNDTSTDGCETPLGTVEHCADCTACAVANGTASCDSNQCKVASCAAPFMDCDGDYADGCESNTQTDSMNCGGCGTKCMLDNAVSACMAGICVIASCQTGWGDCNGMASDGCEHDVSSDVDNCGACERKCSSSHVASKSCSGGVCDSTCVPGWGNCTTPAVGTNDNGCETDVSKNNSNCGGCGNDCGQQGGSGMSDFECDGGFNAQMYCGCGGNGNPCDGDGAGPATGTCGTGGLCTCNAKTCQPGEACAHDGMNSFCSCKTNAGGAGCASGKTCCETPAGCFDLDTDPASCGACGRACPAGFVCFMGACICATDPDCDAGGAGMCNNGLCVCPMEMNNPCDVGARCQPGGKCG